MSDFNRNNDPAYRPVEPKIDAPLTNDPFTRRPIAAEERRSGAGAWLAILAIILLAGGGFYFYKQDRVQHTASNDAAATSRSVTTAPVTTSPQLNNARPDAAGTPAR